MPTYADDVPEYLRTSSGGWDDLDVIFRDCYFGYQPQYTNDQGEMLLAMVVDMVTDDAGVGDNGVIAQQVISIGKGWKLVGSKGERVERENGRAKGFGRGTYLGALLDKCMEIDQDAMLGRFKDTGLQANDAAFWEGFSAHMTQQPLPSFGKDERVYEKLLPDGPFSWVGAENADGGEGAGEKPAPAKKRAVKKAPAVAPVSPVPTPMPGPSPAQEDSGEAEAVTRGTPLYDQIASVAATSATDEEFISRAYEEVPGLDDDQVAMALVDDVESPGCVWLAHGPASQAAAVS